MKNIKIFGEHDEQTLTQMETCLNANESCIGGALCADGHLGYNCPVGGVLAYENAVAASGVGFDIGCGNKAVRTDMDANDVRTNIKTIMDDVWSQLEFGVGKSNQEEVDHSLFDSDVWKFDVAANYKEKARQQLGTIGSGVCPAMS